MIQSLEGLERRSNYFQEGTQKPVDIHYLRVLMRVAGTKTMTMAVQVGRSDSPKPDKDSNSSMQKVMLWL